MLSSAATTASHVLNRYVFAAAAKATGRPTAGLPDFRGGFASTAMAAWRVAGTGRPGVAAEAGEPLAAPAGVAWLLCGILSSYLRNHTGR